MLCITSSSGEGLFDSESEEYICKWVNILDYFMIRISRGTIQHEYIFLPA